MDKDFRVFDREGHVVSQGALNALLAELDRTNSYRNALTVIGCRGIPPNRKDCDCVVHAVLRGQIIDGEQLIALQDAAIAALPVLDAISGLPACPYSREAQAIARTFRGVLSRKGQR